VYLTCTTSNLERSLHKGRDGRGGKGKKFAPLLNPRLYMGESREGEKRRMDLERPIGEDIIFSQIQALNGPSQVQELGD
jgi:hypothetical protein